MRRECYREGFVLIETLLTLGIAVGMLVILLPVLTNVMLVEKRLHQERIALIACKEQVKIAETEPLTTLSGYPEFRLSPHGDKTAVEIINSAITGLVVLR